MRRRGAVTAVATVRCLHITTAERIRDAQAQKVEAEEARRNQIKTKEARHGTFQAVSVQFTCDNAMDVRKATVRQIRVRCAPYERRGSAREARRKPDRVSGNMECGWAQAGWRGGQRAWKRRRR